MAQPKGAMSASAVSTPVRARTESAPHEALPGPVLAVIREGCRANPSVLERAAVLASEFEVDLDVVLLHRPAGFSTDPALLRLLARQRRDALELLLAPVRSSQASVRVRPAQRVSTAGWPWRDHSARTWRIVERVARASTAHLVVVPRCVVAPLQGTSPDVSLLVVDDPTDAACRPASAARR